MFGDRQPAQQHHVPLIYLTPSWFQIAGMSRPQTAGTLPFVGQWLTRMNETVAISLHLGSIWNGFDDRSAMKQESSPPPWNLHTGTGGYRASYTNAISARSRRKPAIIESWQKQLQKWWSAGDGGGIFWDYGAFCYGEILYPKLPNAQSLVLLAGMAVYYVLSSAKKSVLCWRTLKIHSHYQISNLSVNRAKRDDTLCRFDLKENSWWAFRLHLLWTTT